MHRYLNEIEDMTKRLAEAISNKSLETALPLAVERHKFVTLAFDEIPDEEKDAEFIKVMGGVIQSNTALEQELSLQKKQLTGDVIDLRRAFVRTQSYQSVNEL